MTEPLKTFGRRYVEGHALLLKQRAEGSVRFAWPPATATDGAVPIFLMAAPSQPDRCLTLAYTVLKAGGSLSKSVYQLQARARDVKDDPESTWSIDDAVQDVLLGLYPVLLPGDVQIETSEMTGSVSLGADDSNRWEWVSNYRQTVYRPGPNRL